VGRFAKATQPRIWQVSGEAPAAGARARARVFKGGTHRARATVNSSF
jgi:hypothetical protein